MMLNRLFFLFATTMLCSCSAVAQSPPTPPARGGTGSIAVPTAGQIMVGTSGGVYAPATASGDCTMAAGGGITCLKTSGVALTSAATTALGTSGATIPLLNGTNTWSNPQTFSGGLTGTLTGGASLSLPLTGGSLTGTLNGSAIVLSSYITASTFSATFNPSASSTTGGVNIGSLPLNKTGNFGVMTSSYNGNLGWTMLNTSSGVNASASLVIGNDLWNGSHYGVVLGINGSGSTGTTPLFKAGYSYFTTVSGDIVIGPQGSNSLHFVTNNSATDSITVTPTGAVSVPTGAITLGVSGTTVGSLIFANGTSGTITIAPPTGALGTPTLTWPTTPGTLAIVNTYASYQANPTDPTGTTNTTGLMMGLAGSITPTATGKVLVTITGTIASSSFSGNGGKVQIGYGTGTAPANASALAGTAVGSLERYVSAGSGETSPFSVTAVVTGLTVGTAYWLDASLAAIAGGTATISGVSITATELP